jgi:hypothetical protein
MGRMDRCRLLLAALAMGAPIPAQNPGSRALTAVYALADYHTSRWTENPDPLARLPGVCEIVPADSSYTLSCAEPAPERRAGRRYYYSVILFSDLNETLYVAACASPARNSTCAELRAGQTFSAEAGDQTLAIVAKGQQLPMRILQTRPKPVTIGSPTNGTPSNVRPSAGAPSKVPYSNAPFTRGTPSNVRPSQVPVDAGTPSAVSPAETSTAVASPAGARLYVQSSNAAARVYVDGQFVGNPLVDVPLAPGPHTVVVRAEGYPDWLRRVDLPPGQTTRLTAALHQ